MSNYAFEPVGTIVTFPTGFEAQITDISLDIETEDIDVSHFQSVRYREYIPSALKDAGELSCTLHFDPAIDIGNVLGVAGPCEVQFIDHNGVARGTWNFNGYLRQYSFSGAIGAAMTADAAIKVDGDITITPPTSP